MVVLGRPQAYGPYYLQPRRWHLPELETITLTPMVRTFDVGTDHNAFEFVAFIDLLNQLESALAEPCEIDVDLSSPAFFGPSGMVPLLALIAIYPTKDGPSASLLLILSWRSTGKRLDGLPL